MLDLVVALVLTRALSARARRKGYPGYLAAIGVIGWTLGGTLGAVAGALAGLDLGVILAWFAGAGAGALAAFFVIARLPDRSRRALDALEETFR